MLDPNKHGVFNKEKSMKPNWPMIAILLTGMGFWVSIWFNGFIMTTVWMILLISIFLLYLKLTNQI